MFTKLKLEMARKHVSIRKLAQMTEISYYTLLKKMSKRTEFTVREAQTIKSALKSETPIDVLFTWED